MPVDELRPLLVGDPVELTRECVVEKATRMRGQMIEMVYLESPPFICVGWNMGGIQTKPDTNARSYTTVRVARTAHGVDSSENADQSQTQLVRRESAGCDVLRNSLGSRGTTRIRLGHRGLQEPYMDLGSGVQGNSQSSHHGS